jgi:7-cyano-7-deazaguanine synthase in queuosine biosynthesis
MERAFEAVLFSGGLDSMAAAILNPTALLVRVSTGSVYEAIEAKHARRVADALGRPLVMDYSLNLAEAEQSDGIIPGRNALIAIVASRHAKTLVLSAVEGDGRTARDKDQTFATLCSELMTHMHGGDQTRVRIPYKALAKAELANKARRLNRTLFDAAAPLLWSCYSDGPVHCGQCKACVRLWAALYAVGCGSVAPPMRTKPYALAWDVFTEVFDGRGNEAIVARQVYSHANRSR